MTVELGNVTTEGKAICEQIARLAHVDSDLARRIVAFACLLVFSRVTQQERLYVQVAPDGGYASLRIESDATLADCFSALSIDQTPHVDHEAVDLHIRTQSADTQAANHTCPTLAYEQTDTGLRLAFIYDESRMEAIAARDLLEKTILVMTSLELEPTHRVGDLPLITAACTGIIPDPRNTIEPSKFEFIHMTVLRLAERMADQPAISDGIRSYSYDELRRAILHLSRSLIAHGVKPGDVVGVAGHSSFGTLASIIAVMGAGGIMVTLDQTLPAERQKQIATISRAKFIIRVVASHSTDQHDEHTLVTADWPANAELAGLEDGSLPEIELPQSAAAYLFFTSGSTGVPKGVLGAHLGLAHFLEWQRTQFPIGPGDRSAQLTALSFDVVLRDILYPLSSGACVMIPNRELIFDARKLLAWMPASRITVMHSVPSLMKAWLQAENGERPFQTLRFIFFAGEPLTASLLARFRKAAGPKTKITNLYGPTETTLAKLANRIETIEPGIQPVGYPQPGVDVYIVRDRKVFCGLDEIGEIAIRTPYRSKGYFENEEATRQVFVPNPFRDDPEDRIYFTGDLGRYRADGKIEIFGRIDAQIKIRGVRIEPNEIEAQLLQYPGIRDAAITARPGANDDKVLYAFVVTETAVSPAEVQELNRSIREFLKSRLHEAMVPAQILQQEELPYLPNGKLDRKTLGTLDVRRLALQQESAPAVKLAAQSPLTTALLSTLRREGSSAGQSFVQLGGDSLSFITASLIIEEHLGFLPDNWENTPIERIDSLRKDKSSGAAGILPSWLRFHKIELPVALRSISIIFVVLSHAGVAYVAGSTLLFVISGMSFARFRLPGIIDNQEVRPTLHMILKYGIPAGLWQIFRSLYHGEMPWIPDVFLMGTMWQRESGGQLAFWFLDFLTASILIMTAFALSYGYLRRGGTKRWLLNDGVTYFLLAMLAIALVLFSIQLGRGLWDGGIGVASTGPFRCFWLFVLGSCIQVMASDERKWLVTGVFAITLSVVNFGIGDDSTWSLFFVPSVLALIFLKTIPVPKIAVKPIAIIASNSLYIYIVNPIIIWHVMPRLGMENAPLESLALSVAVGIGFGITWEKLTAMTAKARDFLRYAVGSRMQRVKV